MAFKFLNSLGRQYLLFENFKFREVRTLSNGLISWRCCDKNCTATLKTDKQKTKITEKKNRHNHNVPENSTLLKTSPNKSVNIDRTHSAIIHSLQSTPSPHMTLPDVNAHSTPNVTELSNKSGIVQDLVTENNTLKKEMEELRSQLKAVTDHAIAQDTRLLRYTSQVFDFTPSSSLKSDRTPPAAKSTDTPRTVVLDDGPANLHQSDCAPPVVEITNNTLSTVVLTSLHQSDHTPTATETTNTPPSVVLDDGPTNLHQPKHKPPAAETTTNTLSTVVVDGVPNSLQRSNRTPTTAETTNTPSMAIPNEVAIIPYPYQPNTKTSECDPRCTCPYQDCAELISSLRTTIEVLEAEIQCYKNSQIDYRYSESLNEPNQWATVTLKKSKQIKLNNKFELLQRPKFNKINKNKFISKPQPLLNNTKNFKRKYGKTAKKVRMHGKQVSAF